MSSISIRKISIITVLWLLTFATAWAASGFIVRHIRVQGLQRIREGTVLNAIPVKPGQRVTPADEPGIIRAVYNTGFFSDVALFRQNSDLIVHVTERPIIGSINIYGNNRIKKKKIKKILKTTGVMAGTVFDKSSMQTAIFTLQHEYYNLGRYNALISYRITVQSRNRVGVSLHISEGKVAKIQGIRIIGNRAFSEGKLLRQFKLSTPNLLSFMNHNDQYSREKLDGDLESLRSFYMDHGYIKMRIDSTQVSITPDKSSIYILVHVVEGSQYHIKGYKFSGNLLGHKAELDKLVKIQPGQVFSRKDVIAADSAVARYYANLGYAFANVQTQPKFDEQNKTIFLTFVVIPSKKVYINRIAFMGNIKTADYVLRREMRLMEGSLFSWKKIDESKRRLSMLGYITGVQTKSSKVPGTNDKINLMYKFTDKSSATANFNIGYSNIYKFLYGINIKESNVLGTGKTFDIGFNHNEYMRSYYVTYMNPYYTLDGISQALNLYIQQTRPGNVNLSPYNTSAYGASLAYGIPISEFQSFSFSLGYEHLRVGLTPITAPAIVAFVVANGNSYEQAILTTGWNYSDYDRAIMPTNGLSASVGFEIGAPVFRRSLSYYTLRGRASYYRPIYRDWIFHVMGNAGYGDGLDGLKTLPFFKNFYAGGIGSVRGYLANTLGPKDMLLNPLGGNILLSATAEVIVPNPVQSQLRTSIFIDAGNVYQSKVLWNRIRYSAGVAGIWWSPFGPLEFSLSKALNKQPLDRTQAFQFSVGTSF